MKLSNNAIKFLMAQYRAIYKNAYFKGIASAVVLTTGLAAGQAQAADAAPAHEKLASGAFATSIGTADKHYDLDVASAAWAVTVSGGGSWNAHLYSNGVSGNAANSITSKTGAVTLKGNGTLTIKHGKTTDAFNIKAADAAPITIDIATVDVNKGTLSVAASGANTAALIGDVIKVGAEGIIKVTGDTSGATLGDKSTAFQMEDGAVIEVGQSGAVLGNISAASGGEFKFTNKTSDLNAYGLGANANINIVGAKTDGTATKITIADDATTKEVNEGLLQITSGSYGMDSTSGTAGLTIKSGTLEFGKDVKFTLTGASGATVTVGSGSTSAAVLKVSKDQLKKVLENAKGQVNLGASGAIILTDTTQVDVSEFQMSGSATDQKIGFSGSGSIYAADMLVSKAITKDGSAANDSANTLLKAQSLTLGSDSYNGTTTLGFGEATAESLTMKSSGAFTLANKVKLATSKTDSTAITGNVLVSGGALTVEQGAYTAADGIDVKGGTLAVTAAAGKTTSLTVTGNFKAQAADNSKITVSGSGATLNLTGATVTGVGKSDKTIAIGVDAGTLKLKGTDVTSLISNETKGGLFTIKNNGLVEVDASAGELVLDAATTKKEGVSAKGFNLNGGKLAVKGSLVLSGTSADLGTGTIQADSLTFKSDDVKVASGNYVAMSSLGAVKADGTTVAPVVLSGSVLTLGSAADDGGEITSAITIGEGSASGTMSVAGGTWSGDVDIENKSGSLVIGGKKVKAEDIAPAAAGLSVNKLTGTAGKITVEKNASLQVKELVNSGSTIITISEGATASTNKLTVSGGSLSITGSMTVRGDSADTEKKGVDLVSGNKNVVVTDKGNLEFGSTAVSSMLTADGEAWKLNTADLKGFTSSSIDLRQGGTVKFSFDSGVSLASADLVKLRDIFGVASGSLTAGVLDLGNATINGVTGEGGVVVDGKVAWNDIKGFADVNSDVVNKDLADVIVTNISEDVRGNFGSLQQAAGSTDTQIGITTSSSLSGANKNNGLFASDSTGKNVVGLSVKNGTLTLNNSGEVGKVSLANGSVLKLNAGQGGTITVKGDVAGKNTSELLVTAGTANVTGAANVGFLDSAKGSVLNAGSLNAASNTNENIIDGVVNVTGDASFAGALKLSGTASVGTLTAKGTLDTAKGSALKVTTGAFTAEKAVDALGTIEVTGSGSVATFKNLAELNADGNKFVDVNFNADATILGDTEVAGKVDVGDTLNVIDGATLKADTLTLKNGTNQSIRVGTAGTPEQPPAPANPSDVVAPSNAYLSVKNLELNGGFIVVDPDYDQGASIAAVKNLTDADTTKGTHSGQVKGQILALQNSIVSLGNENVDAVKATFAKYLDSADGSLNQEQLGSIVYVANSIKLGSGDKIVIDGSRSDNSLEQELDALNNPTATVSNLFADTITIGENTALAVDYAAVENGKTAITFFEDGATTPANATATVAADKNAKVLLAGNGFSPYKDIQLFGITKSNGTAAVEGAKVNLEFFDDSDQVLEVETVNGLFSTELNATSNLLDKISLQFSETNARKLFGNLSAPVRDTLITYGMKTINGSDADVKNDIPVRGEMTGFMVNKKGQLTNMDGAVVDLSKDKELAKQLTDAGIINPDGSVKAAAVGMNRDENGVLYYTPSNELFNRIMDGTTAGVDAETAARLADFGGVAQAALRAGNTTSDAIAARMGVGVNGTVTFAANGQGSGMWVTPVYKTADSDSFGADGVDYGTDMNLYGVAVGADVSVMENVSAGVMFNVGSGDADGQGLGSNVKNDFDYYGFGAYMGYTMGAASVVADVSWTTVDNSVEGQTGLGTLAASIDSSALSLGVTGKYAMDFGGVNVTPHAGLRFTRIDQDDYSVGNGTDVFAQYSSNSMNVFSVPVGVTVEKEYTFDAWSVKPAFDLTLTGNFGDDETSGTVDWEGISNLSTDIKSEFVDTFTYSTAIGVAAQTGNFGMGLGVNYTGASNVKEFGVNANVRYVF
ncbi:MULTISPECIES: autotransporter domain-containing protein [unclassified Anaerobiospirillum]|uniref:autotransporter domain-containing protein n=1 Tax=unclassified Anaerobiospirillum TaxID=2647410 RepID=UPI001FF5B680|nr:MULTISPECIES: autotransporter domain-containing protein [unclassified Anaerobiospirillum]MCK0535502.1 autotransporter domain-containing protein [Anaerobiospirillum sp. NML120511]MCK0540699.1 autotransporter domain-containing protein [Anaerobiospirillum sp. NML02-A-032]